MKKIKIGFFGCMRGLDYAKIIRDEEAFEIVAFCDNKQNRLENAKKLAPDAAVFTDFEQFIEYGKKVGMDAVFLANDFNLHAPYAIKVMDAGMYALSECLPAVTLKECVELVRAAERNGGRYMFCENYPWMVGNLELCRLIRGGKLGEILYLEGEYNHHDRPEELYSRSKGKYHWRNWEPRCYYLSHSLAPLMMMVDGLPKYISCQGAISPMQKQDYSFRAASEGLSMSLVKFDNGKVARFSGCNAVGAEGCYFRIEGDRGLAEWNDIDENQIRLLFKWWTQPADDCLLNIYEPDLDRIDPRLKKAADAGHGGSDYMVVQNMISFIRDGVTPYFDVYKAASISACACYALRSMLNNGQMFEIPDFKNSEALKAIEDDDLTPFYDSEGNGGTIRPSIDYTPDDFDRIDVFKG